MIHVEQARCFLTLDLEKRIHQLLLAFPTWKLISVTLTEKKQEKCHGNLWDVFYFWMVFEESDS